MSVNDEDYYPMGENPPLPPRAGAIRMIPPDGNPITMDRFTLGKRYGPFDLARDCGCEHCQAFLAKHQSAAIRREGDD